MKLKTLSNKLFVECRLKIYSADDELVFNGVVELIDKDLLKHRVDMILVKDDILNIFLL